MRDAILYESLKLFSTNGYEAVSTRMIARAVGASDAVVYKHFKSKREIFDVIVSICKERYVKKRREIDIHTMEWNQVEEVCMDMFRFQTQDEWIVLFRRLVIVEQFKNPEMALLYQKFFIGFVMEGMTAIFAELIKEGYMKEGNPRVYAMELYAPFFMYHTIENQSEELLCALKEHVTCFRNSYRTAKCDEE